MAKTTKIVKIIIPYCTGNSCATVKIRVQQPSTATVGRASKPMLKLSRNACKVGITVSSKVPAEIAEVSLDRQQIPIRRVSNKCDTINHV
jgi:hypothetical protein